MGYVVVRGAEAREKALSILRSGGTLTEAAAATGYKRDYVRQLGAREGIRFPRGRYGANSARVFDHNQILHLYRRGLSRSDIARRVGCSYSLVNAILQKNGMWSQKIMSVSDYVIRFCIECGAAFVCDENSAQQFCSNRCSAEYKRKQDAIQGLDKERIEALLPDGFSYVRGYSGCDGTVILRCNECGHEFERSMISIRHRKATRCPSCTAREKEAKELVAMKDREERERLKEEERNHRLAEIEKERLKRQRLAVCPVCGKAFYTTRPNMVCCSPECSKKRANGRKDKRIKHDKRIDRGITAKSLYVRDGGVCWICGEKCDLNDYVIRDRTIICGNKYPSVDHIIPVCEGGCDSWENVRLAHRWCNLERYLKKNG